MPGSARVLPFVKTACICDRQLLGSSGVLASHEEAEPKDTLRQHTLEPTMHAV